MFLKNREDGAILILSLMILSVSVVLVTGMNYLIYNTTNRNQQQLQSRQLDLLTQSALEKAVYDLGTGDLAIGETTGQTFGAGKYTTKVDLKRAERVNVAATAQLGDREKTLKINRALESEEVDFSGFNLDTKVVVNDDTSDGNDYITASDFQLGTNSAITLQADIKLNQDYSKPKDDKWLLNYWQDDDNYFGIKISGQGGTKGNLIAVARIAGNQYEVDAGATNSLLGTDRHWITAQIKDGEIAIFVDGQQQATNSITTDVSNLDSGALSLNSYSAYQSSSDSASDHLQADYYEFRAWSEFLSADEIENNRNYKLRGDEADLEVYYLFNSLTDESRLTDQAGNHDGVINGAVKTRSVNSGLSLNGTSDYKPVDDFSYNSNKNQELTVMAKLKTSDDTGIIYSFDRSEYFRLGVGSTGGNAGELTFHFTDEDGVTHDLAWTGSNLNDGAEHVVAAVFEKYKGKGRVRLYLDGVEKTITGSFAKNFGTGLTRYGFIGTGSEAENYDGTRGPDQYLEGEIEWIQHWDKALPKTEIDNNKNNLPDGTKKNLVKYYNFTSDNKPQDVLEFDGVDDYVAIEDLTYTGTNNSELTIMAEIETDDDTGIIYSFDRSEYFRFGVGSAGDNGKLTFNFTDDQGTIHDLSGQTSINDGQRHVLAVTFDSGTVTMYVDGEVDETFNGFNNNFGSGRTRYGFMGVGSEASQFDGDARPENWFGGQVYWLHHWDKALKSNDNNKKIDNYSSGDQPTGTEAGLLSYYQPQPAGVVTDLAQDNNGALSGGTRYDLVGNWNTADANTAPSLGIKRDLTAKDISTFKAANEVWYYKDQLLNYDPTKIYKIEARVKQVNNVDLAKQNCFIGVEGLASDGTTMININGVDSHENQHYMALYGDQLDAKRGWQTFVGYFSGTSSDPTVIEETATNNQPSSAAVTDPMPLYSGVQYFRPVLKANSEAGSGTIEVDYIKVEELQVNNSN